MQVEQQIVLGIFGKEARTLFENVPWVLSPVVRIDDQGHADSRGPHLRHRGGIGIVKICAGHFFAADFVSDVYQNVFLVVAYHLQGFFPSPVVDQVGQAFPASRRIVQLDNRNHGTFDALVD